MKSDTIICSGHSDDARGLLLTSENFCAAYSKAVVSAFSHRHC